MARALYRPFLTALAASAALGLTLAGCSAQPLSDSLPQSLGGLPSGTPARPVKPYQYPAVHDMPPPRSTSPLTDQEQLDLEKELRAARDRQEVEQAKAAAQDAQDETDTKPAAQAKKQAAPAKKKKPGALNLAPPAGAKTTGAKVNP